MKYNKKGRKDFARYNDKRRLELKKRRIYDKSAKQDN